MAIIRVKPGPSRAADGTYPELRGGTSGEILASDAHGRYLEPTRRGNIFFAATGSGQTTTVGLATTYVGLVISNPLGNTYNLSILKVGWAWSVIASTVNAIGLLSGYSATSNVTHTAAVTPASTLIGTGPASTAKVDTSATLVGSPVYTMFLDDTPTATTNAKGGMVDLEGSIVVPPGGYLGMATVAASSTAGFWASFMWEEVPVVGGI